MSDLYASWSTKDTHCPACLRPYPTAVEEDRHADRECYPDPCWCWAFCWVRQGGDCAPDEKVTSFLSTGDGYFLAIRSLEERAAALEAETVRLRTDVVRAELAAVLKPDAVDAWLEDEIPALGGKRPVDLIPSDEGYELVRALIDAIAEGVFT